MVSCAYAVVCRTENMPDMNIAEKRDDDMIWQLDLESRTLFRVGLRTRSVHDQVPNDGIAN